MPTSPPWRLISFFSTVPLPELRDAYSNEDLATYPVVPLRLGWALKQPKEGGTRFNDNQLSFLRGKFDEGARTGRKADPHKLALEMQTARTAR